MRIAIASDHGGFDLKESIKKHLKARGEDVTDMGTYSSESVDYPVFGNVCAQAVISESADRGIVICGTGIGISIAANRNKGMRCALCTDTYMAEMSRKHNNANMLALGGRVTGTDRALEIVDTWLTTDFEGGRHQRRVDMLDSI